MRLKLLLVSLGLFVLASTVAGALFVRKLNQPIAASGKVELLISSGESVQEIGEKLQATGVMNSLVFVSYVRFKNLTSKIQAGKYEIPLTLTPIQVVELLQHGTFDVRLTFLEGWRREQDRDYALEKLAVDDESFSAEFEDLTKALEGYLFPDTYIVPIDIDAQSLVALLKQNFEKKYQENILPLQSGSGLTKKQIVIIASLLERETAGGTGSEEMKTIAGILIRRWKSGWRLEVDATVQYVLGYQAKTKEWWKDTITAADKKIDLRYNTYKYAGLPPGPIANPGLSTLLAVVNYKRNTSYWFYLHCKDGKVRYASTLEDHIANKSCLQ